MIDRIQSNSYSENPGDFIEISKKVQSESFSFGKREVTWTLVTGVIAFIAFTILFTFILDSVGAGFAMGAFTAALISVGLVPNWMVLQDVERRWQKQRIEDQWIPLQEKFG